MTGGMQWFAVRCIFQSVHDGQQVYEERITLWCTTDIDAAIAQAETEARAYALMLDDGKFVGLAQAYHLGEQPRHGAEVFSLIRQSNLTPDRYLDAFFDTHREYQTRSTGVGPRSGGDQSD